MYRQVLCLDENIGPSQKRENPTRIADFDFMQLQYRT